MGFDRKNRSFFPHKAAIVLEMSKAKTYASDAERWQALRKRDPDSDGKFYYSVSTTGVYCRPNCPSKPARREHVHFHDSCEDAERAGFRPCKRCQPAGLTLRQQQAQKIAAACRTIETAETAPSLDVLAKAAGLSPFHFHRLFKRLAGVTPKAYAAAHRTGRVRVELSKRKTVTEAIYEAGFNSNGRFYSKSQRMLGMTPQNFRKGGDGEIIRFEVGECSLGSILVAASGKGICAISMGDDPKALVRELEDRFSKAQLVGGDRLFERTVTKVIGLVESPGTALDLPLDI